MSCLPACAAAGESTSSAPGVVLSDPGSPAARRLIRIAQVLADRRFR
ncbi:MAG: hypothetical protein ACRDPO_25220 [Streptosporangiaceae bacterium]